AVADFYSMLLRGDNSADERLENNDVIFVPVIGSVVGVVGDIKRPAIYELKPNQGLRDAIKLAAGTSPFSNTDRIQVVRVENHRKVVALDVHYRDLGPQQRFQIHDGDLVRVYHVLPDHTDVVQLAGNVRRPGEFQWYRGMRVSDLIRLGEGVSKHTFFKY